VLVLLPPSEGKASSGRGAPLKPESLSLPGLTEARAAVLDELVDLCAADEDKAREVLGLSEGLRPRARCSCSPGCGARYA
jgi:hypothetical protein